MRIGATASRPTPNRPNRPNVPNRPAVSNSPSVGSAGSSSSNNNVYNLAKAGDVAGLRRAVGGNGANPNGRFGTSN